MATFNRKQNPFLHGGMNWNSPPEKLQQGQIYWAKNVRVLEQGTISSAHGLTLVYGPLTGTVFGTIPGSAPAPGGGFYANYIHTLQRLNILNTAKAVSTGDIFYDQFLRRTYVLGADNWIYAFQDTLTLLNPALNPLLTPGNPAGGATPDQNVVNPALPFSGNPLSIVDSMPFAGIVSWKYVGDSNQMVTLGYYPGDFSGGSMARCLTMGMTPPVTTDPRVASPQAVADPNGNLIGAYQWIYAYRRVQTGARSNPSAATRQSVNRPATTLVNSAGQVATGPWHAQLVTPRTPIDPQTGQPDTNVVVDVYRFGGSVQRWALIASLPGNTAFVDNHSDLSLLAAPSPPQTTDASTGLTRFNLFRPFVVQDIRRGGQGAITQVRPPTAAQLQNGDHGGPFIFTANTPSFRLDWLPGSTLNVDGNMLTIYQVLSPTVIELAEDLTGTGAAGTAPGTPPGGNPGGTTPPATQPPPTSPPANVVGPVSNLQITSSSFDTTTLIATATFTFSPPTVNVNQWAGTGLYIVGSGGQEIGNSHQAGDTSITAQYGVPASGATLTIAAITYDTTAGWTDDLNLAPNSAKVVWTIGDGGTGAAGEVNNLVLVSSQVNADGSVTGLFEWGLLPIAGTLAVLEFAGVQLWMVQSNNPNDTVPQHIGGVSGQVNPQGFGPTSAYGTAPQTEPAVWTVSAITVSQNGQLTDDPNLYGTPNFRAQAIPWDISGTGGAIAPLAASPRVPSGVRPPVPPPQPTPGSNVHDWETPAGTPLAGQPLPHLWGVYGLGSGGSYIFGCGDPNAPSTLYWTNGNDPDSTDIVNNIVVTSPSEKLVTGCIYQGQPYCWTTERMFQVFPSVTVFGQFTTQEVAGAKGVWQEWSLTVQNNGFADTSVSWRGKDGIYDWSNGGLNRMSDPLYAFFPHDGTTGLAPETIIDAINGLQPPQFQEHVGNIDDTQPKYHRLCWFQGLLFYDFVALTENPDGSNHNTFSTLVWDSVNVPTGGWVSLDQLFDSGHPVARSVESGATDMFNGAVDIVMPNDAPFGPLARGGNMKVTWGPNIYDYFGTERGFESRVITAAEDIGDSRAPKLWGDFWIDCAPLDNFEVTPLVDFNKIYLTTLQVPPPGLGQLSGQRDEFVMDFPEFYNAGGKGLLNPTLGLDFRWRPSNSQFAATLYQWSPSYIVKPEFVQFRSSDRDDQGALQCKYLMALNVEANTLNNPVTVDLWVDGVLVATKVMTHDFQSEHPYGFEPYAGYEFQVQLQASQPNKLWQLHKLNWLFDPWPDAVARKYSFTNLGDTSDKFIQGIVLPMETGGETATVGVWSDDDNIWRQWTKSTLPLKKTGVVLDINPPFTAHILQFQTYDAHRIWWQEARVVWEPIPEQTNTWRTQETDHDMGGWHSLRDCFIAYMGGSATPTEPALPTTTPTLTITTEYGSMQYQLDPVSPGQFVRCYRVLAPQKAKWRRYSVDAPGIGIRLYAKDTVIRVKQWGSAGPYIDTQPFGDNSRQYGARM